jgi:hypothetical protein
MTRYSLSAWPLMSEGRDVTGEQLVVVLSRGFADGHQISPIRISDLMARRSSMAW